MKAYITNATAKSVVSKICEYKYENSDFTENDIQDYMDKFLSESKEFLEIFANTKGYRLSLLQKASTYEQKLDIIKDNLISKNEVLECLAGNDRERFLKDYENGKTANRYIFHVDSCCKYMMKNYVTLDGTILKNTGRFDSCNIDTEKYSLNVDFLKRLHMRGCYGCSSEHNDWVVYEDYPVNIPELNCEEEQEQCTERVSHTYLITLRAYVSFKKEGDVVYGKYIRKKNIKVRSLKSETELFSYMKQQLSKTVYVATIEDKVQNSLGSISEDEFIHRVQKAQLVINF